MNVAIAVSVCTGVSHKFALCIVVAHSLNLALNLLFVDKKLASFRNVTEYQTLQ